ncbi:hypothetical protein [Aeoliella sp.]|uniref:hypothetical protein n=1 Tax=Aeoliella sp. TaxID=2795800 RepID=UPI003CCC0110
MIVSRKPSQMFFPAVVLGVIFAASQVVIAQESTLFDSFETGGFSTEWSIVTAPQVQVIGQQGNGAGPSDFFARFQRVDGAGGDLGVTLPSTSMANSYAEDFEVQLDFRVQETTANQRQFAVTVSATSLIPNFNAASLNLRYQDGTWSAYTDQWNELSGLAAVTPGEWNHLTLTGTGWGTGAGNAVFGLELTDHLGSTTSTAGLRYYQHGEAGPDTQGAKSLNINNIFGGNPGFDIDNVWVSVTEPPPGPTTEVITPVSPVAYSGIYPHLAVTNTHNEVGVGGMINRGDAIYYMTYGPHIVTGGSDKLYAFNPDTLERTTYLDYPGNTDANRYTDSNLGLDILGAAYIDPESKVRFLPVARSGDLRGRITGTAAHLSDPNKLYYATMEEGLYEVDFSDLDNPTISVLREDGNVDSQPGIQKNLPGVHGKGLYTGQQHLYFTNNGADGSAMGGLVEWDGNGDPEQLSSWTIVDDRAQYTEVTSKLGPSNMDPNGDAPIWATGWDDASMFINVRDAETGQWHKFRAPKSSYTHGHPNGWYTEWPRIRDVGLEGGYLMSHHGMMFLVPQQFSQQNFGGLTPLRTHHKMIVDYVEDGDRVIFGANDASRFDNELVPQANSNLMFVSKDRLASYGGAASGFGGPWMSEDVASGQTSDAFLVGGFEHRLIHFSHDSTGDVEVVVEVDSNGTGNWVEHQTVVIPGQQQGGYAYTMLPSDLDAQWMRVRANTSATALTTYMHLRNAPNVRDDQLQNSLLSVGSNAPRSQGIIRSMSDTGLSLEFAADILDESGNVTDTGYYRASLNPMTQALELIAVDDTAAEERVRSESGPAAGRIGSDDASAYIDQNGTRYRLPRGPAELQSTTGSGQRRTEREVVTERGLANVAGTFYEIPLEFQGGGVARMRPLATHNLDIYDFASWRGMLVLSGNRLDASEDGHFVQSDDDQVGLWFGNVDDLWHFGSPEGTGGPWLNSQVAVDQPSDPYLMAGFDKKSLQLSHGADSEVDFTVEIDFLGTGDWEEFDTFSVSPGEQFEYIFESGYSAHWIRFRSSTATNATAQLVYESTTPLPGDYNRDGQVDQADYQIWKDSFGAFGSQLADGNGDGAVNLADYTVWRNNLRSQVASSAELLSQSVPEPGTLELVVSITVLLMRAR